MAGTAAMSSMVQATELLGALEREIQEGRPTKQTFRRLQEQIEQVELEIGGERQFRALVEHAADGIARFGRDYRFHYVNPAMQGYTGLTPQQCAGKTHRELGFSPAFCEMWENRLHEALVAKQPVTFDFDYVSPAGRVSWHQARLVPEINPATGEAESVLCVGRDITDAKRYEQALRRAEQFNRAIPNSLPAHIAVLDREGTIIEVNQAWTKFAQDNGNPDPKKVSVGANYLEVCRQASQADSPEAQAALDAIQAVLNGSQSQVRLEYPCHSRQEPRWFLMSVVPLADAGQGAVVTHLNITENKQYEQALRDSEERFRLLVDGVKDYAMFLLDPQGNITTWNSGAERLKGYTAQEIIGKHVSLCYVPEDIVSGEWQRHLEIAAEQGRYKGEGWIVRKDGSKLWAEVVMTALRHADGTLRGFAEIAQDITERKRVEEQLRQAKEAAEQASRAKDHFLAVLSHELRTPLTPVLTTVQMTERQPTLSPDLRDSLGLIHRNVELEARLIDDLLDVTRISRGKIELHQGPVDLHSVLRHVMEVCSSDIRSKRLSLKVQLDAPHHHVQGDSARLQQVFWNLLKNAIKFTPADGSILIGTEQIAQDRIAVTVKVTGVGIEPELLPNVFNIFEQGGRETTRQFGGLGLGLAIGKALVEMHGGTITASSEGKGQGAAFAVALPVSVAAEAAGPQQGLPEGMPAGRKGGRILLVEDHPDTARTMSMLLRSYGYDVRIADGVGSALHLADVESFDLLISDLGLPDGSGLDLMRQLSVTHPVKGIAVSGFGMEEDVRRSKEAGFAAHVTKPIDVEQLEQVIGQVAP